MALELCLIPEDVEATDLAGDRGGSVSEVMRKPIPSHQHEKGKIFS